MFSVCASTHEWSYKRFMAVLRLSMLLCVLLNTLSGVANATDDVAGLSSCELESIINQLVNPNPEYQLHVSALRSQLKNLLRDRQLAAGEEQSLNDYDYPEEDKRSVASLASLGLLRAGGKRSLATLAKNGQLPTQEPEDLDNDDETRIAVKRYIGALARSGGFMGYGKRNIGTLARDFQLPQNGKRNVATLARLGLITSNRDPKRNLAAVARYNSNRGSQSTASSLAEKRNLGALKGSPVHGGHQKRDDEETNIVPGVDMEYVDMAPGYWLYPSYNDVDWETLHEQQKRFLDTSKDPELFGIYNALPATTTDYSADEEQSEESVMSDDDDDDSSAAAAAAAASPTDEHELLLEQQQKRHIGSIARSGFLPSYRALRSTFHAGGFGSGGGGAVGGGVRFSRSGRARQFVEYFPQRERLRQPIAAVCKRCFLPYRPVVSWGASGGRGFGALAGVRSFRSSSGRLSHGYEDDSIRSNTLPTYDRRLKGATKATSSTMSSWGTPPRITALHRRSFRRPTAIQSYQY